MSAPAFGLALGFTWSEASGRYRNAATGRFVARDEIRAALDQAIINAGKQINTLSQLLREGEISLAEWQLRMAEQIKAGQIASAAAGRGGFAQLTQADLGRIGQIVRTQYEYLGNFARQIEANAINLDGGFLSRAAMYVEAIRPTFHVFDSLEQESRGMLYEMNRLHPADHCEGCLDQTERGAVPIGSLIPIGARQCGVRCRCTIDYTDKPPSQTGVLFDLLRANQGSK